MPTPPHCYTTADWGAEPAKAHFALHAAKGIVIHNTEGDNRTPAATEQQEIDAAFDKARSIQHDHMHGKDSHGKDRNWSDSGQHFLISRGGILVEGRHGSLDAAQTGMVVQAAHAGYTEYNESWFGIEVEGNNLESDQVTDQEWVTLVKWCAWLTLWSGKDVLPIIPHLAVHEGHTNCPGHFKERIPQLITEVAAAFAALKAP